MRPERRRRRGGWFGPGPRRGGGGRGRRWGGGRRYAMAGGGTMAATRPGYMPRRGGRGGGFPLTAGIIVLALLGVVLWLFLRSGGAGGGTSSVEANGSGSSSATVESNGNDLLGLAADGTSSDFEPYENQSVHASNVPVQSTVGDGVFWVGTSSADRLLVIATAGSAPSVSSGDIVSVEGTMRVLPVDFATRYGVSDTTDRSDLERTGHYIEAERVQTGG